jgi:hypothetical protein
LVQVREVIDSHDLTKRNYAGIAELLDMVLTTNNATDKLKN